MRTLSVRSADFIELGTDWQTPPWQDMPAALLDNYMGKVPNHFPKTEVKLAWGIDRIWVMFRVEDRYIRAVAKRCQDSVCGDSCVEFFFMPGIDEATGYFNIEMNCGGTILFHFHPAGQKYGVELATIDCDSIETMHSMPRIVDPEIESPSIWTVQYSVPISLLRKFCEVTVPRPGATWRANFYKCADKTSHPHWLTWSPVDFPTPNFHLPQSFGKLVFE
jgi:hypothetical protein